MIYVDFSRTVEGATKRFRQTCPTPEAARLKKLELEMTGAQDVTLTPESTAPAMPQEGPQEAPAAPQRGVTSEFTNQGASHTCESPPEQGPRRPPAHILAANAYAATFRDRDPLEARAADLPEGWRAVVQHGAKTEQEAERHAQHRDALQAFLGMLVSVEVGKVPLEALQGLGIPARQPLRVGGFAPFPASERKVRLAEIDLVASALWLEEQAPDALQFAVACSWFAAINVQRWLRYVVEREAQKRKSAQLAAQRPTILKPGDPGFRAATPDGMNREQRRAAKRGR